VSKKAAETFNCQKPSLINISSSPFVVEFLVSFVIAVNEFILSLFNVSVANNCNTDWNSLPLKEPLVVKFISRKVLLK